MKRTVGQRAGAAAALRRGGVDIGGGVDADDGDSGGLGLFAAGSSSEVRRT